MATVREAFLSRVRSLMEVLNQSCNFDDGNIDNMLTRGNLLYHHAVRLASVNIVEDATIAKLRAVVDLLSEVDESKQNLCFQPEVEYTGAPGRPKICVTKDQLSYLVDNGFKATDMARMLGISDATVHRRLKDFNLQISHSFSTVDDNALDCIVRSIKEEFPNSGYRMVCGHLKGRGLVIQQIRVRESLRRIDPEGTILRWLHVTERRKYNFSSPNALWHIDGHHKLIRLVSQNYQNFVHPFVFIAHLRPPGRC